MYTNTRDLRFDFIELLPIKFGRDKNSSHLVETVPYWVQYRIAYLIYFYFQTYRSRYTRLNHKISNTELLRVELAHLS
jgi:hypothetical protein